MVAERPGRLIARRLRGPLFVLSAALLVSSCGYVVIAEYGWFDALYMTVITLGAVGFSEVRPLGTGGRWWTIAVILSGLAVLVYFASVLTAMLASGDLGRAVRDRRRARMRERIRDHVIVVGFGRVGRAVVAEACRSGNACIVIDRDGSVADAIRAAGAEALFGDGIQEATLREAGLDKASALVATAPEDPTNLLVVLTAHAMRPALRIVARVNDADWHERIVRAGASVAMSPYADFGAGLAASAVNATILSLHELAGVGMESEEIVVTAGSPLVGRTVSVVAAAEPDLLVIGVRRLLTGGDGGKQPTNPAVRQVTGALSIGDVLVVIGSRDRLERFQQVVSSTNPPRRAP